ncbi:hypothetical protein Sjap_023828 [Stephania japonica]|uniref:Uncharacterized protein n=1 Tax=Stephania japonica TaxID=461633 RepID=A0AAP0ECB6_9MAGN
MLSVRPARYEKKECPRKPVTTTTPPPAPEPELQSDETASLGKERLLECSHCREAGEHHFKCPPIFMPPILAETLRVKALAWIISRQCDEGSDGITESTNGTVGARWPGNEHEHHRVCSGT